MRLIDADALINDIMMEHGVDPYYLTGTDIDGIRAFADSLIIERIASQPTVDAEPVRHGKWTRKESKRCYWYECSECGYPPPLDRYKHEWFSDYCPHCGARIDEVEE